MSERTAGATDPLDQLVQDVRKAVDAVVALGITRVIEFGVPPGMVIVPASDVLTGNQRVVELDDLRALLKAAPLGMRPSREAEAFLNRIKAIADGGAK